MFKFTVGEKSNLASLPVLYPPQLLTESCFNSANSIFMASRSFSRALRSPLTRQFAKTTVPRQTLLSCVGNVRVGAISFRNPAIGCPLQISRGLKTIDFAGHKETVYGGNDAYVDAFG